MITLSQIVSSNLEMLKEQEASLLESLDFIRKARELFESRSTSESSGPSRSRRGRKRGRKSLKESKASRKEVRASGKRGGKDRLTQIMEVLQARKTPISSGELLQDLFSQQTLDKDKKHFATLIYPVLSKAYKSGTLKLKNGKIHMK